MAVSLRAATSKGTAVHVLVDTHDRLPSALDDVDTDVVGVDVERTTAPRYFKPAAVVQVGVADRALLIDSHVLGPTPEVGEFLRDRTCVLHAATNDIESLDGVGMRLEHVEDTSLAAALLGHPVGLDPLLQEVLGVSLGDDKDRFQRADWERRPLPDDMAAYAAGDVVHLPALLATLTAQLEAAGRQDWYRQECEHVLAATRATSRRWDDTRGAGRLDPRQRAVLRAVWERREQLARDQDDAPQALLRDKALVDIAASPPADPRELARRNQRRGRPDHQVAEALFAALQQGRDASEEPRPGSGGSRSDAATDRERHAAMRRARAEVAEDLGIEAGVLCPGRVLWGGIHADPDDADELVAAIDLRDWQRALLRDPLWEAYTSV